MIGCYPGSFDPPTVAHLAVAEAAVRHAGLERLDLVISRRALGKPAPTGPALAERLAVLELVASTRPWLAVRVTDRQLLIDIAAGYDVVVMGADKWAQVLDAAWYASERERDAAVRRLPRVLVAPRAQDHPSGVELLDVPDAVRDVSASQARAGRTDLMLPEAAALDARTGAWSRPRPPRGSGA